MSGNGFPGLDDQEWWLLYGLQGLIGGLLGAAAVGIAVAVTLRHERKQARVLAARETGGALQLVLVELITLLEQDAWDRPRAHELYRRALSLATRLSAETARDWPYISKWVWNYRHNITDTPPWGAQVDAFSIRQKLTGLDHLVESWFREPSLTRIPDRPPQDTPRGGRF